MPRKEIRTGLEQSFSDERRSTPGGDILPADLGRRGRKRLVVVLVENGPLFLLDFSQHSVDRRTTTRLEERFEDRTTEPGLGCPQPPGESLIRQLALSWGSRCHRPRLDETIPLRLR